MKIGMINQEIFLKELAVQIKRARKKIGKTQMEILLETKIHIGRIEQGKLSIQMFTYYRLCKYLGVDCAEILQQIEFYSTIDSQQV
jgi:transcriptional regulator with XRE-family HTH domain